MVRETYKALTMNPIKPGVRCRRPTDEASATIDTPAIDLMTDFHKVSPAKIHPDATLKQATDLMVARGIRLLFVAGADDVITGVITARDTMGERPVKLLQERGGRHGDLRVADVMTPHAKVEVIELAQVLHAEVGHLLQTLKRIGRQHALVVERDPLTGVEEIRGMFSATAIGRRLGVAVQTFEVANTFAEIEAALATT
jgi:CBS domain-containing protein